MYSKVFSIYDCHALIDNFIWKVFRFITGFIYRSDFIYNMLIHCVHCRAAVLHLCGEFDIRFDFCFCTILYHDRIIHNTNKL